MEDFSEEAIRKNCPHCDKNSAAFEFHLEETDNFSIVCDANPIIEGHILIIPNQHISCIAAYSEELFTEFLKLDIRVSRFILGEYGSISSFEHGVFGQTVFHSHVHYLPFSGKTTEIIPEKGRVTKVQNLEDLKRFFKKDGGYLYFSIGNERWVVNPSIAAPRFFRDRFAKTLGRPERGDWKAMRTDQKLMKEAEKETLKTQARWKFKE